VIPKHIKLHIYLNVFKKDKQKLVSTNEVCKEALTSNFVH